VALGLHLPFLIEVHLGIQVVLVLVDQGCLSLNLRLGLAWDLLPDAVDLGQVFLQCLGILGFCFLLGLGDFENFVVGSDLHNLIRMLKSPRLGLRLEMELVQVVRLPA